MKSDQRAGVLMGRSSPIRVLLTTTVRSRRHRKTSGVFSDVSEFSGIRITQYRNQVQDLLTQRRSWFKQHLKAVVTDGQYAKAAFMDVVDGEGYAFVTKLQSNANLVYSSNGEHPKRRGDRQKWAGKVDFVNFTDWTAVPGQADEHVWTRVVWGPHFRRFFRVVVVENLDGRGEVRSHVVLCSTDTSMPAESIRALYSARFQLEFVFRDAKQFAGLTTCQLRSAQGLENHWEEWLAHASPFTTIMPRSLR